MERRAAHPPRSRSGTILRKCFRQIQHVRRGILSAHRGRVRPSSGRSLRLRFAIYSPKITRSNLWGHSCRPIALESEGSWEIGPAVTKMKVKSFTYERNWTGKYYRQRLLPSMQTMDKHIESMLSDGWEIMTETSHSGNSRGFRPFAKRDTITVSFRRAARFPPVEKDTSDRRHGHIKDTIS